MPVGAQEAITRGSTLIFTPLAGIGAKPGGITRRAPGRTSRPPAGGPLSAGEGPSLSVGKNATFPFPALITPVYYHPAPGVSSKFGDLGVETAYFPPLCFPMIPGKCGNSRWRSP